jgi:tetratricopeptide (TPR) repeat protein
VLLVLSLAVWAPATRLPFVNFDDPGYLFESPHITAGLRGDGIAWAFTRTHNANWHPLTTLSHMLDVELFGLAPHGPHTTNVALHALAALVLFAAFSRMSGAPVASAALATLFAIHPLRVESVAWVSERKDVLCGLGWMLALQAWAAWAQRPATWRYALVVLSCALALLAKPIAVGLPLTLLLLDLWPLGRWRLGARRLVVEKGPLFAMAAALAVVTLGVQTSWAAVVALDTLPLGARVTNALVSYVTYVAQTVWPSGLAVFYPLREVPAAQAAAAGLLLAAVTLAVVGLRRSHPHLLVGWLWYVVALLPVIGLVQVGEQARADRYTYIPSIGLGVMAVWSLRSLALRSRAARVGVGVAAILVLAVSAVATRRQLAHWESSVALFSRALAVAGESPLAHANLAEALTALGRHEEALGHYEAAARMQPESASAQTHWGVGLAALGDHASARARYDRALQLDPTHAPAHFNLGALLAAQGRVDEAAARYHEALRLRPDYAKAHSNLGLLLLLGERTEEALVHFEAALRAAPGLSEARGNLALALEALGRREEAVLEYREALRWRPDDPRLHHNLGNLLAALRRPDEAEASLREAARLRGQAGDERDTSP